MTPLRKKEAVQAELTGLEGLAAITPRDDPFASGLLQNRIEGVRQRIQQIEDAPPVPETEIMFAGGPVFGSSGIDAKFAAKILDSYQDMVTNEFAAAHSSLRRSGRRKGESDAKLLLTALPRGSVGIQLAQPIVEDFVTAQSVAKAMAEVTTLVAATGASDEEFEEALVNFHPRVFKPLQRFFDAMVNSEAECRLITGLRDVRLNKEEIEAGAERVSATEMTEETIKEQGKFGGVLVASRKFEFSTSTGNVISGWLAESVTEEDAERMAALTGHICVGTMKVTLIQSRSGKKRPSYELSELESLPREAAATLPTSSKID